MTFLATVTIAADTDTARAVTDPAAGEFSVTLLNSGGTAISTLTGTGLVYSFPGLPEGDYTVAARLNDVSGNVIGDTQTTTFTVAVVPPEVFNIKTVSAVSVVVTPE